MEFIHNKMIANYLTKQRVADFIIKRGFNYLIPGWEKFVLDIENEQSIFDYINDLDKRYIIYDILKILNKMDSSKIIEAIKPLDKIFFTKTFETNECLKANKNNQYNRDDNWYYYRITKKLFKIENDLRIKNSGKPKFTKKE